MESTPDTQHCPEGEGSKLDSGFMENSSASNVLARIEGTQDKFLDFLQGPKSAHSILHLSVRECCVLHFLSSLQLLTHQRDWKVATGTLQRAAPRYWKPISCVSGSWIFQLRLSLCGWHHGLWLEQCSGRNISRKQYEMQLIFELGTLRSTNWT